MSSTLYEGKPITREVLEALPMPESDGPRHKPVHHFELVETLDRSLANFGFEIEKEEFGLYQETALMVGVMDLKKPAESRLNRGGQEFSIGLRSGNNKSVSVQLAIGLKVTVCANGIFDGDLIALKRKQTTGMDLSSEVMLGVHRYVAGLESLVSKTDHAKQYEMPRRRAREIIYEQFIEGVLPGNRFQAVHRNFFEPNEEMTDIHPFRNTLWALHNAFTREARTLKPARKFEATAQLGKLLEIGLN